MNERLAVIGGSGAYHLLTQDRLGEETECRTLDTPFGAGAPIHRFQAGNIGYLFMSRHGETDYAVTAPFVNYRANIYALKECGVERIISWSGPASSTPLSSRATSWSRTTSSTKPATANRPS